MSSSVSRALASDLARRRRRAHAHQRGLDADRRPARSGAPSASAPRSRTARSEARISAAPPSTMPDALPAVTHPFLLKAAGSSRQASQSSCRGADDRPGRTARRPLRVFTSTGTTSSANRPSAQARAASCWLRTAYASCASREIAVLRGAVLGGGGHGAAAVRVEQRRPQRVFELPLSEPQPAAQAADDVRRLAHALGPAGQHEVGFAEQDHLRAADRRLDARAAQPVDRQRRHFDRQARLQRRCDARA